MLPYFTRILQEKAEKKIPDITPETPSLKRKMSNFCKFMWCVDGAQL